MKFSKVMYAVTTHETMDVRSDFLYDDSLLGKIVDEIVNANGYDPQYIRDELVSKRKDSIDNSIRMLTFAYAAAEKIIRLIDEKIAETEKTNEIIERLSC